MTESSLKHSTFQAYVIDGDPPAAQWRAWTGEQLDDGDVTLKIDCSALNYKDALAATGHPGIALKQPLIPGIDAVGTVVETRSSQVEVGEQYLIADARFGTAHHGGFSEYARVSANWLYPLPANLAAIDAVTWGTAGFTAAQSVAQLLRSGVSPQDGPALVTGATGGVGIFAVALLAKLGFEVCAATGKLDRADWLRSLGASTVLDRRELNQDAERPLLKGQYAAAVDTVGGQPLDAVLRRMRPRGCVTACGLVAGEKLNTNVFPFILRGVTLAGIDSANLEHHERQQIWDRIGAEWNLESLNLIRQEIGRAELPEAIQQILAGGVAGRIVFSLN